MGRAEGWGAGNCERGRSRGSIRSLLRGAAPPVKCPASSPLRALFGHARPACRGVRRGPARRRVAHHPRGRAAGARPAGAGRARPQPVGGWVCGWVWVWMPGCRLPPGGLCTPALRCSRHRPPDHRAAGWCGRRSGPSPGARLLTATSLQPSWPPCARCYWPPTAGPWRRRRLSRARGASAQRARRSGPGLRAPAWRISTAWSCSTSVSTPPIRCRPGWTCEGSRPGAR